MIERAWMEVKKVKSSWGGKRKPSPGKTLGRPSGTRTWQQLSVRLDPWLITQLGLRRGSWEDVSDHERVKQYILRGAAYLASGKQEFVNLQPARALYGVKNRGWTQDITNFQPTFHDEVSEILKWRQKGESISHLLNRLVTIAAAEEGISRLFTDITLEDIPIREEYQQRKPRRIVSKAEPVKETPAVMKLASPTRKTRTTPTKTKAPQQKQRG